MIEYIKREIYYNDRLSRILKIVSGITIIEYDGANVDGSIGVLEFLDTFTDRQQLCMNIILLGDTNDKILDNEKKLKAKWHSLNIIRTGNRWDKQNFETLNISSILILHILFNISSERDNTSLGRLFRFQEHRNKKLIQSIIDSTRCAYYASFMKSETDNLFDCPVTINFKGTLDDLRFTASGEQRCTSTLFCSDRKEYMEHAIEHLDPKDSFFLCFDEMESGCTECNQCGNYKVQRCCPMAQCKIAEFYHIGNFIDHNDTIAHQWYLKAARQSYQPALIAVANDLMKGTGCKQDIVRAVKIYASFASKSAYKYLAPMIIETVENNEDISPVTAIKFIAMLANEGNTEYIKKLADAFENGRYGLPVDEEQKRYWENLLEPKSELPVGRANNNQMTTLIHSAENGDITAQIKLCELYFYGETFPVDYEQSAYWGEKALAQGDRSCRFKVAYSSSRFGNRSRALTLYSQLAEEGDCTAMNNLGYVEKDLDKKVYWFKKAADSGNYVAQYNIGLYYKEGRGVEQSYKEMFHYMEMSAKNGFEPAMIEVARLYKRGCGVEKDTDKMLHWYEKAIAKGNVAAMLEIAFLYRYGDYIAQDSGKAMEYYRKAVQTGDKGNFTEDSPQLDAMYNIGRMWELGEAGTKNTSKAIFWFRKAALHNHADSKKALIRLGTNWIDKNGNTVSE